MGAWSAEIFDDDGADEIKTEYKILLGYGLSPQEVYQKIEDYFYPDYQDQHDEDVYWLSIALFQWENGILLDAVKQRALECIADDAYLKRWKDSGEEIYQERKAVLEELKYKLTNVVNEERKKFPKCPKCDRYKTKWKEGDLLAYKMTAPMLEWGELVSPEDKSRFYNVQKDIKNRYLMLRVVAIDKMPVSSICPELDYSSSAIVMLYDWMGDKLPEDKDIDGIRFKPIVNYYSDKQKKIVSAVCLELDGLKEEKKWGEITLIKSEENFPIPNMYIQHPCAPLEFVSQFNILLIHTFALREDEKTEWYDEPVM